MVTDVGSFSLEEIQDLQYIVKPREPIELAKSFPQWKGVTFVSTWEERCGIALYTKYLIAELIEVQPLREYSVIPVSKLENMRKDAAILQADILHIQHEYGIAPEPSTLHNIVAPVRIATIHNISLLFGIDLDPYVDAYIVHNQAQFKLLRIFTEKPIYVIPHGSKIGVLYPRDYAREKLGLPKDKEMIYMHGMGEGKNYLDLIRLLKDISDVILVCLVSVPDRTFAQSLITKEISMLKKEIKALQVEDRVVFINRWVSEEEIDLLASATDVFVFNYKTPAYLAVSASGAIHRILFAGKPIICTIEARTYDLKHGVNALKYEAGDLYALEAAIVSVLSDKDLFSWLGSNARLYAYETSWRNVAIEHIKVYNALWGEREW